MGVLNNNYDIIIIAESWLTIRMNSAEFFPSDYAVFRKDRYDFDTCLKGGGVIVAVKNVFSSDVIAYHPTIDIIAVRVKFSKMSAVVIGVYVQYASTLDCYNALIHFILSTVIPLVHENEHFMIVGDFNLPDITWFDVDGVFTPSSSDERAIAVMNCFASISTIQLNRISNSRGKYLDLLFSNELLFSEVSASEDLTGCTSVHHTPITINIFFYDNCVIDTFSNLYHFNFSNADYVSLNEFLSNADWGFLAHGVNLNEAVLSFNALLNTGIKRYVPLVKSKPKFREPWFNSRLVNLEKRRNKLHKLYRIHGAKFYSDFAHARKEFSNLNWFLYNNHILQIEQELSTNPKKFWNFVNTNKKVSGFPSAMSYQSSVANTSSGICDLFAQFFESVYEPAQPLHISSIISDFKHILFTSDEVRTGLLQLDTSKGTGYDGFPPILFKSCAESLTSPIMFLFNESIRKGFFPDPWKISVIHPIFKSGKRNDVSNYRGISILSVLPKLLESMVQKFLSFHLKKFICSEQHGFLSGRSTVTNLTEFCGDLFGSINSKMQLDVVYTDFAKAFDKIDHIILFSKLAKLNCEYIPITWLRSYLTNRLQMVKIRDSSSYYFRATSGVPQGSHIGPLLFNIFINDVVDCFKFAKCLLFADDLKIFAKISNASDCQLMQNDLNTFCTWSKINKLLLNVSKCKTLTFYRVRFPKIQQYLLYDNNINRVEYFTDLGVTFSADLTFTRHIDHIVNRAYITLGYIKRNCGDFCDPLTLKALYVALVRSILEYASPVWSPFYRAHSDRIESVQKQFILYALRRLPASDRVNRYALPPYKERCNLLGLTQLNIRRDIASIVFVRDLLSSRVECAELLSRCNIYAPERCMRRRDGLFQVESALTNYGLSEPMLSMSRRFNITYEVFDFHSSRNSFKNSLIGFLN